MNTGMNSRIQILIVDDTPASVSMVLTALEEEGYSVSVAKNGEKALELAKTVIPDLILLDILMPGMDGYETCQKLKSMKSTKDIPIIFLSGLAETYDKVKGFHLGAVDYLIKPIEIEELLARVKTHVSISSLERELIAANQHLEERVAARTSELLDANAFLKEEIAERKKTEEALAVSEEKYRTLVESIHVGVYQAKANQNGSFLWANQAMITMFGYDSLEEFLRIEAIDLYMNPQERKKFLGNLLKNGFVRDYPIRMKKKDGTQVWISVTSHIRYGPDGSIQWTEGVIEDITADYQLEELKWTAFSQIEKNMEQFAILNDQIRNPLSIILAFSSENNIPGRDIIEQQVKKIDSLIDMLDRGYLESEKVWLFLRRHQPETIRGSRIT